MIQSGMEIMPEQWTDLKLPSRAGRRQTAGSLAGRAAIHRVRTGLGLVMRWFVAFEIMGGKLLTRVICGLQSSKRVFLTKKTHRSRRAKLDATERLRQNGQTPLGANKRDSR